MIDVSVPEAPIWVGQTRDSGNTGGNSSNSTSPATPPSADSSSGGIGAGAIAGIVVGVVAAAAVSGKKRQEMFMIAHLFLYQIAGVLAFMIRRKKQNRPQNSFDYYVPPPQDFNMDVTPTMFAENGNTSTNNIKQHEAPTDPSVSQDPVPSYPVSKPHDEHTVLKEMASVKPSGNEWYLDFLPLLYHL